MTPCSRPTLLWHPARWVPSPGELRCASGVLLGLSRRRPAGCGNASVGNASVGNVSVELHLGAGKDQPLPRGARGSLFCNICRRIFDPG